MFNIPPCFILNTCFTCMPCKKKERKGLLTFPSAAEAALRHLAEFKHTCIPCPRIRGNTCSPLQPQVRSQRGQTIRIKRLVLKYSNAVCCRSVQRPLKHTNTLFMFCVFRWRTKQNLDYSFLMMYAVSKGVYYVQVCRSPSLG